MLQHLSISITSPFLIYPSQSFEDTEQVFYFILNLRLWRKILVEDNLWNDKRAFQDILNLSFSGDAFDELYSMILLTIRDRCYMTSSGWEVGWL